MGAQNERIEPMAQVIDIAKDFSRFPGGRYISDGPGSGQEFREKHLVPALRSSDVVVVRLDGAAGYAASFLEEAFGGAVLELGYDFVNERLRLEVSDDPYLIESIRKFMQRAATP